MTTSLDKQALKILFDAYWSSAGWKPESERTVLPENFAYAKSRDFMFAPLQLNHSQALNELAALIKSVDRRKVADGFLSSLSTRRLDWRSALGSYAIFQHVTTHNPQSDKTRCNLCGFYLNDKEHDLNVLNFERLKWGGVRHYDVIYALMDIGLFLKTPPPSPAAEDVKIFRGLVSIIKNVQNVTSGKLNCYFTKDLKSNKPERDVIIAILGFCGILGTPLHPGYSQFFIPFDKRELPNRHFVDMAYPACWWHSSMGINEARLNEYFGHIL